MKVEVREIGTEKTMFANLGNSTKKEVKDFISFYQRIRVFGRKKYEVKTYQ
jgi:hypothetical protein